MTLPPSPPTLRTGKLCYLEIPAVDVHQSATFYQRVFGWNIRAGDTDRPSFDDTTGGVSGAWVQDRTPDPDPGILPYIMVADASAATEAVVSAGGRSCSPRDSTAPRSWRPSSTQPATCWASISSPGSLRRRSVARRDASREASAERPARGGFPAGSATPLTAGWSFLVVVALSRRSPTGAPRNTVRGARDDPS
jgi:predicted enzyme related to lactoylglutathione lyase